MIVARSIKEGVSTLALACSAYFFSKLDILDSPLINSFVRSKVYFIKDNIFASRSHNCDSGHLNESQLQKAIMAFSKKL